jgi:hypothetical protein
MHMVRSSKQNVDTLAGMVGVRSRSTIWYVLKRLARKQMP